MVLRPTSSSAVTTATIHLPIQIWVFCLSPQITYLHTKNEEGLKIFISNFASLSWRVALKVWTADKVSYGGWVPSVKHCLECDRIENKLNTRNKNRKKKNMFFCKSRKSA